MSGNENTGDIIQASWTNGISGRALSFNGTTAQVTVPDSDTLNPTDAITVALWIAPNSWGDPNSNARPRLLQKGLNDDQYRLFFREDPDNADARILRFSLNAFNLDADLDTWLPSQDSWYHIAGTYDGTVMQLFVNGWLAAQQEASLLMTNTYPGPLFIGSKPDSNFFDGDIDDVRIYGRALTAEEIQNLASP
jgi:hypothetical protein